MKKLSALTLIISLFMFGCKADKKVAGNYSPQIECLGSEMDGSITLKAWGKGRARPDALEQARKEALNAVLFLGIRNGKSDCDSRPILNVPNIRETKADYFNTFFQDGGNYQNFVSAKDESFGKKERVKGRDGDVMYGFIVRVNKSELKKQMIKDGILNN